MKNASLRFVFLSVICVTSFNGFSLVVDKINRLFIGIQYLYLTPIMYNYELLPNGIAAHIPSLVTYPRDLWFWIKNTRIRNKRFKKSHQNTAVTLTTLALGFTRATCFACNHEHELGIFIIDCNVQFHRISWWCSRLLCNYNIVGTIDSL